MFLKVGSTTQNLMIYPSTLFRTTNNLRVILSRVKGLTLYITRKHTVESRAVAQRFKYPPHKFDQSGGKSKFKKWNLIKRGKSVGGEYVRHIFNEILLPFNYHISRSMPVY